MSTINSILVLIGVILGILMPSTNGAPDGSGWWTRGIHAHGGDEGDQRTFGLVTVQQRDKLIGDFLVAEKTIEGERKKPFVIEGRVAENGTFWPHVEIQVSNDRNGEWKTIAPLATDGPSSTVTLYPGLVVSNLTVNFDVLKPLIDKYRFGRVVLRSGDTAIFELSDLSQPAGLQPR